MRKVYKTLEELRAVNAMRQRKWREKNRRTHRERVLEQYGKARAQKFFESGVTPEEVVRYARSREREARGRTGVTNNVTYEDLALVEGEPGEVRRHARAVNRRTGREIPAALMEPSEGGGHRNGGFEGMGQANERGVGQEDTGRPTPEEKKVAGRLQELKARQARGGLNRRRGVAVEIVA